MTPLFYGMAVVLIAVLVGTAFVGTRPETLARSVRLAGPIALGAAGGILMLFGRVGLGGTLISGALAWYARNRITENQRKSPGKKSAVRTAALEMELDHDSGGLEGMVLAGRYEGRMLGKMSMDDLIRLRAELTGDSESLQLLETYLDSNFPVWRDDAKAHEGGRLGGAPGSGPMTKQEAYKVLGLEAGASATDIRKAHRRLMQRLHPDLGGSSFLAARINEAKDVLLSDHG
ncbi:MAG TPA: DnaJ domain-containing protein [Rhizobiaceae bacterium]|nr:DnaJ domain-containing protein [Rhizobiaceae bacterium]